MDTTKDSKDRESKTRGISRAKNPGSAAPKLLLIALGAVLVIAAILFTVSSRKKAQAESESASIEASIAESIAAEEAAKIQFDVPEFTECAIPELSILAEDYFNARLKADSKRLKEIFGKKDAEDDPELDRKLKAQADWIQEYEHFNVYSAPGLEENTWICIVKYDIDFRRTDTLAPGVMYFYVKKEEDGSYKIVDNPMKDTYDYIEAALNGPSAKAIIDESNAALKAVLDTDSTLALIYYSFRSGEIYKESDIEVDKDQQVGFFSAEDSILVDASVLENIRNEAAKEAAEEAALAAEDETE